MKKAAHIFILFFASCCLQGCREKYPSQPVIKTRDYEKAQSMLGTKNDSAFYYFNKAVSTSKDSLVIATCYNYMAAIQSDAGDYFGAQESLLASLGYLHESRETDYYCLSSNYNELGTASLNLKNYTAAIGYYNQAIKFAEEDSYKKIFENNLALCYQKAGDYAKALLLYRNIALQSNTDRKTFARILTNQAFTRWLQNGNYNAAPELWQALFIRKKENDDWGLNSSYGHLADYYMKPRPDSALFYAEALYATAHRLHSPDDEIEALQKMILLTTGKNGNAYFIRYQFLNDSLQTARNNAKNQFALIRYDAAKNKADNLKLQTENSEKKLQILWQRTVLYSILLLVAFTAWWSVSWYRKRKRRLLWETENAIRVQQLKTSQKVHDVVAGGLYRIMSEIEHQPQINKLKLIDDINALYEKSRDISYDHEAVITPDFDKSLSGLLLSFASPATRVMIAGNEEAIWDHLSIETIEHVEHILKELMINMKKHSKAENVVIKFERKGDHIKIDYTDDGIGLPSSFRYGNGLTNTENRIKVIGGSINFGKASPQGLKIQVNFSTNQTT